MFRAQGRKEGRQPGPGLALACGLARSTFCFVTYPRFQRGHCGLSPLPHPIPGPSEAGLEVRILCTLAPSPPGTPTPGVNQVVNAEGTFPNQR